MFRRAGPQPAEQIVAVFVRHPDVADQNVGHAPEAAQPGPIVDQRGRVLGRHSGIHRFTVGQRKGLGLSGGAPLYVLRLDAPSGTVTVGPRAALEQTTLTASGVNWIATDPPAAWIAVSAQIRHRHHAAPGRVRALEGGCAEFVFDVPQPAITPGQAVVFYDGDLVVGGGWIDSAVGGSR